MAKKFEHNILLNVYSVCTYINKCVYVPPMYIKWEILPFVHELVWENDMFICSGDLFVDDDVVGAFCAVLLFGLDIFASSSSSSSCFSIVLLKF